MRAARLVFVCAFLVLLLLPSAQAVLPFVKIQSLDEKRRLAAVPDFKTRIFHGDGRLATDINNWFDDRIGFRPLLIRLNHQIEYSLFGYADKVYIGSEGWLYSKELIDQLVDSARRGEALDAKVQQELLALYKFLERRNIRLVIVSNPIKASVEAQYLPLEAPRLPHDNPFQRLREFLKRHQEWIYVDGEDVQGSCGSYQLYHRMDEHILMPPAYCIAKEVVRRIAMAERRSENFWNLQFTLRKTQTHSGGLVSYLSLLSTMTETVDSVTDYYSVDKPPQEGFFDRNAQTFYVHDSTREYEWVYKTYEQHRADKLPPIVLYGNSFTDFYFLAGFQFQFAEAYRLRSNEVSLPDALTRIPPSTKYFMLQFLEPYLVGLTAFPVPEE
jgi:SGNH hydrolase-like domain, acetyltransferase AlgX